MNQDRHLRRRDIFKRVRFQRMMKFKRSQSTQSIIMYFDQIENCYITQLNDAQTLILTNANIIYEFKAFILAFRII